MRLWKKLLEPSNYFPDTIKVYVAPSGTQYVKPEPLFTDKEIQAMIEEHHILTHAKQEAKQWSS